jgi:site-specific recombinase XerD
VAGTIKRLEPLSYTLISDDMAELIDHLKFDRVDVVGWSDGALRHACGYKLANDGKDTKSLSAYLGHKNIQNTMRYTEMAPNRFKDFWVD